MIMDLLKDLYFDDDAPQQAGYIDYYNRKYGSRMAQNIPEENPGYFGSAFKGAKAQSAGVIGGQADMLEQFTGVGDGVADYMQEVQKANARGKEYGWRDMLPGASDYWTNPWGAAYDIGGGIGSSATLLGETLLAGKALGAVGLSAVGAKLTGAIGSKAAAAGMPWVGKLMETPAGKALVANVMSTPLEAFSEGGNKAREVAERGGSEEEQRDAALQTAGWNMALMPFLNAIESAGLGGLIAKSGGKETFLNTMKGVLGDAVQNTYEEGMQESISEYADNPNGKFTDIVNPFGWSEQAYNAAAVGGVTGGVQGGVGVAGGKAMNAAYDKYFKPHEEAVGDEAPTNTEQEDVEDLTNDMPGIARPIIPGLVRPIGNPDLAKQYTALLQEAPQEEQLASEEDPISINQGLFPKAKNYEEKIAQENRKRIGKNNSRNDDLVGGELYHQGFNQLKNSFNPPRIGKDTVPESLFPQEKLKTMQRDNLAGKKTDIEQEIQQGLNRTNMPIGASRNAQEMGKATNLALSARGVESKPKGLFDAPVTPKQDDVNKTADRLMAEQYINQAFDQRKPFMPRDYGSTTRQEQGQLLANLLNARAASEWDKAVGMTKEQRKSNMPFVPQRASMYNGALRRNLAQLDNIKPAELPSVSNETADVNRHAAEIQRPREQVIPQPQEVQNAQTEKTAQTTENQDSSENSVLGRNPQEQTDNQGENQNGEVEKVNTEKTVEQPREESKTSKKAGAASAISDYKHTTKKTMIKAAKLDKDFSNDEFKAAKELAEENGGFYSKYASQKLRTKGVFLFEKGGAEGRDAFVAALNEKFGDKQEASVDNKGNQTPIATQNKTPIASKEDVQKAEVERVAKEVSKEPSLGMYARKGDQADFVRHYMNVAEDTISELGEDEPLSIDSVSTKELEKMFALHMVKLYDEIRAKDNAASTDTLKNNPDAVLNDNVANSSEGQAAVKSVFDENKKRPEDNAGVEANIAKGQKAMRDVIEQHIDVRNAMERSDVGSISFYYGTPGTGSKFKRGYGISHIIAKRDSEGLNGKEFAMSLPEVIARGEVADRQTAPNGDRLLIKHAATTVVLSLYKDGNAETWVVTGWNEDAYKQKEAPTSDAAAVYDADSATSDRATRSRSTTDVDASANSNVAQNNINVKKSEFTTPSDEKVVKSKQNDNSEGGKENADNNGSLRAVPQRPQADNVQETGSGEQVGGVPEQKVRGSERLQGRDVRPAERTRPSDRGGLSGESETQQQTVSTSGRTDKRNVAEQGLTPAQQSNAKAEEVPGHNFIIKSSSDVADNGAKTKFKGNIAAITLLKKLEAEGRMATPSEQKVLAKYIGWGPLQEAFNGKRYPDWESEAEELKNLLTPKEWNAARDSVLTAFYTPPEVIKSIYGIVQRLGFKGGRVLDPAMGSGNFFGAMPERLRKKCMLRGVEIETISGGMAKQLYQDASVEVIGYENAYLDNEGYDLVITNVPFKTDIHPVDADFKAWNFNLHNYFFAKSVQKVRPGGLICFITSENTMKSNGKDIRKYLADKVDFIGAIKLPDNTFKSYAGTTVTSDLIILQKRGEDGKPSKYAKEWLRSDTRYLKDAEGKNLYGDINEYYVNNPEMVIGQWAKGNYGSVIASGKGLNVSEEIDKLVEAFPKNIYKPVKVKRKNDDTNASTVKYLSNPDLQNGSIVVADNGEIMVKSGSGIVPFGDKAKKGYQKDAKCAGNYVRVRDIAKQLLEKQLNPEVTDEELQGIRNDLNKAYDNFVAEHGPLGANNKLLSSDPDYGLICSIENYSYNKKTKETTSSKTAIFTQRTVNAIKPATSAANENDALLLSLSTKGRLDLEYMQQLLGGKKSQEDILAALGDKVFKDPVSDDYVMADEYLSGNVREKLERARMAAQTDKSYTKNVKALEKVIPQNLTEKDIHASLGSAWIPAQDIEAFANELMETNKIKVDFVPSTGTWTVDTGYADNNIKGTQIYGTKERSFGDILSAALNQKAITVTHDKKVDAKATDLANAMVKKVQDAFEKWIWKDEKRRDRLVNFYNNNFNATVLREYDGSMLNMPGYSAIAPQLRKHQKDAIWRIVQNGTCLLAHCVGAGKTWVMQASAMEQKRLGLINKPMFTIPNHMVEQFTNEFRQIYPNAKLLVLTTDNLPEVGGGNSKNAEVVKANKAQRKATLARIATEDWDGIIISHELFKRIPMSQKAYEAFYQEQIDELENALSQAQYAEGERSLTVKELVSKLKKAKEKMENLMKVESKDLDTPFDKLGIDQIYVDEADLFKNLSYVTNMTRVSGLSNSNSQRSQDMYIKTQYLLNTHNGRGVVFATGTPISNTIAEMFTMLRYLNQKALKEHGVSFFDTFINTFSKKETTIESKPEGNGYRQVEKFVRFYNMGGLKRMFREVADVKTQADLDIKIPELKNGKRTVTEVPGSKELNRYITEEIKRRAEDIHNGSVQPDEDNMLKLTSDMRKATLDMRLLDKYKNLPLEVAAPKLKVVAENVYKKYQESSENKGTQLIFCDLATPKGTSDKELSETANEEVESKDEQQAGVNAYSSIGKELIKMGIPAKEIAFIHDAKNDEQKEALFAKVRNGEVRVLIGSTSKMGAGTNIQKRVIAEHHVDCPWRPRDIEQREGRALRQGNINDEVEIFTYITKGSLDEFMWEKIKNKASMIEQAMNADLSINTVEDISAEVLSYAEIQGLASGDPFIPKRVTVAAELNSLNNQYREYRDNIVRNKRTIAYNKEFIAENENTITVVKEDIKKIHSVVGDDFTIKIDGKTFDKFSEAEEFIFDIAENSDRASMYKGSFGGLDFTIRYQHKGFPYRANYFNNVDYTREARTGGWVAEFDSKAGDKCYISAGSLRAMSNLVGKSLDNFVESKTAKNKQYENEIAEAEKAIKLPFDQEDKLKELQEEQARIDKHFTAIEVAAKIGDKYRNGKAFTTTNGDEYHSLGNTKIEDTEETSIALLEAVNDKTGATEFIRVEDISDDNNEYSVSDEAVQRTREEVLKEVKKALPTAKISYDSEGNLVAEMPNGRKVGVVIEEQILLNQQQAKSAGKAHNTIANEAEGYWNAWEKLNGSDVLGVIHVSRNSRVGTAFHEVLHAAMDLSLTSKEKDALYKHFEKVAEKSGRDIEEEIADGYKEWVLKRQQGQGSLFGKLYKKAIDFLNKLYTMFVNANNVGNTFRKLESGKAWSGNAGNNKNQQYSVTNTQITGETRVPVIDVTELPKLDTSKNAVNVSIAKSLIGKEFRIIGSNGIGRVASIKDGKHLVNSSQRYQKHNAKRQRVMSAIDDILNNAVYVDKHSDTRHGTDTRYIELYAVVKNKKDLTRFRIVAKEGNNEAGMYEVKEAKFYDIIKNGNISANVLNNTLPASISNNDMQGQVMQNVPSTVSVAELLFGVKDKNGKPYVDKYGGLIYEPKAMKDIKYSVAPTENKLVSTFTNTKRKNIIETFKDWLAEQRKDFYVKWFDKNDRLHDFDKAIEMGIGKKVGDDKKVYDKVQNLSATTAGLVDALMNGNDNHIKAVNERLKHKKLKHNVTMQMVIDVVNKGKMNKLHPDWLKENGFDSWVNALGAYLGSARLLEMSKRAKEEGVEYKLPNGLTSEELMNYIAKAPAEFKRAADLYYKFNDNMLTIMEDAGLISEETHRVLNEKYKHYCPLMRDFSDTAAADAFIGGLSNGGRGIANVSNPLKRISIEGSERNVFNPLESTVNAVTVICNRAERNKVGQMAVELAQEAGLENVVVKADGDKADEKNCIFTVMFNGKKQAYQTSQELYGPIVGYNLPAAGLMLGIARSAAHLLRTGATMSPSFIVRNLIRDTIFAGISSKNGFIPILDTIRGAQALLNDPKMKAEFETAGITSFNFYNTAEEIAKSLDEMADNKNWREYTPSDIWKAIINHPTKPFFMTSEFVESATRMGEYLKAREKGLSIEEAARAARELTLDFSRSGVSGEKYNQVVPFFNACLQGGDKLRRLFKEDFFGTLWNVTKYIILPSFVLWMLNHDEDWYKEIDPSIKNTNWILPGGIRIPKPQEAGVIFGSGIEAMFDIASGKDKAAMDNWSKEVLSNMLPNIIPTVFLPIIEWQANTLSSVAKILPTDVYNNFLMSCNTPIVLVKFLRLLAKLLAYPQ